MTRFVLTVDGAINAIFDAIQSAQPGDIYVPILPSLGIVDLAEIMVGDRNILIETIGTRPGEKTHEIMITEEEVPRTTAQDNYYVVSPVLPKIRRVKIEKPALTGELSSADYVMSKSKLRDFLQMEGYLDF
jgi:UDP-glucose 4-epimerase